MIGKDGHIRIVDFGMVKFLKDEFELATTFCGTPDYMAPEILNKLNYGFKVDVWALAVMLFELSEGFSPFQGNTEDQLFHAIKYQQPRYKFAKKLKPGQAMRDFIESCLNKDFEKRPDVSQLVGFLKKINSGMS